MYSFGRGDTYQIGHGTTENLATPTPIKKLSCRVTHVSAGSAFSVCQSDESEDNIYVWGYGEMGQLMTGEDMDVELPERVELKGRRCLYVAAGGQHTTTLLSPRAD